jgi:hypothetical protein
MKIEDLFGEELLGRTGKIINQSGYIKIDSLPVSIPIGVSAGQKWQMRYANRDFSCGSRAGVSMSVSEQIHVSCTSDKYTLNFNFDRTRGVTEFQDFCDFAICNFRLIDPHGLLSSKMTKNMGLPDL